MVIQIKSTKKKENGTRSTRRTSRYKAKFTKVLLETAQCLSLGNSINKKPEQTHNDLTSGCGGKLELLLRSNQGTEEKLLSIISVDSYSRGAVKNTKPKMKVLKWAKEQLKEVRQISYGVLSKKF